METMIERVGRAIALADDEDYMEDCQRFDKRAKAAITAMRQLSLPMMEAANKHVNILMPSPAVFWQVVLDAALSE